MNCSHAVKYMKKGSAIINSAHKGNAKLLDYTATKEAIVAFTKGLAQPLVRAGIRVNAVVPAAAAAQASFDDEEIKNFGKHVPMQRVGQPMDIAPTYVFLASDRCSPYFTGQVLHAAGTIYM